ncbi:hypothetical protein H8E52_07335 [bacterium]|nr:hypothetical protein [bacterium]
MKRSVALMALVLLAACAPEDIPCPEGAIFSVAVVHPDSIESIDPLGNINPPGHTFPSDHMGIYLGRDEFDHTYTVNVYCPGDLKLVRARAVEHLVEGITDFAFDFEACPDMVLIIGHVGELDPDVFAGYMDLNTWHFDEEYSTGGETYRVSYIEPDWDIAAGVKVGRAGIYEYQGSLDYGFYDRTRAAPPSANKDRWGDYGYLHAFSPLDYYPDGALKDELAAKVAREEIPNDPHPFGRVMQDVPGTAHGCWFMPGGGFPPEDAHLALVQWNSHPSVNSFSVGNAVPSLFSGIYPIFEEQAGLLNAPFDEITPDGMVYAFHLGPDWTPNGWVGAILLHMPDSTTIWIEGFEGHIEDPEAWIFTRDKTVFKR